MGYIGMCGPEDMVFYSHNGLSILADFGHK